MVLFYLNKIKNGTMTVDKVPTLWRAKVEAELAPAVEPESPEPEIVEPEQPEEPEPEIELEPEPKDH